MSRWSEHTFGVMGCTALVRVLDARPGDLEGAAALLAELDAEWSRFRPDGALGRLNTDRRPVVAVPPRLAWAIGRALDAAVRSGGLVDPTLGAPLRRLGYDRTFSELDPAGRAARSPARRARPARPAPDAGWRRVEVDEHLGLVHRPPGLELDLGGIGKGLAADLLVERLGAREHVVVSLGGDVVCGGHRAREIPQAVTVDDPHGGPPLATLELHGGAAATSGVTRRAWRAGGEDLHHLLDPATGRPAHTGLVQVTALAPSGLEAERIAKQALLAGPAAAPAILAAGGVLVADDGTVTHLGPVPARSAA